MKTFLTLFQQVRSHAQNDIWVQQNAAHIPFLSHKDHLCMISLAKLQQSRCTIKSHEVANSHVGKQ